MGGQKITIRNVRANSLARIRQLRRVTRLPLGALLESAVDELWQWYDENGWDLDEPELAPAKKRSVS